MVSFERLSEITHLNLPAALCVVIETKGSTPRKSGSKMVVFPDGSVHGKIEGTIGGGAVEHQVRAEALQVLALEKSKVVTLSLTHDLGMCCGGEMTVFIEPLLPKPHCIIFGAGHIGEVLSRLAAQAGFFVTVADARKDLMQLERLPYAHQLLAINEMDAFEKLPFGPNTFIIVVTHDHQKDQELIEAILVKSFRYAALVGSKRKSKMTITRCLNKGLDPQQVAKLHCPAGVAIDAETPEEIAFSIVAQMIQYRRKKS